MSDQFVGEIRAVAFNFAPSSDGWLPCEGQLLQIADFETLFAVIGAKFGGDGVTTFALPDYRGRAPVGMGTGPGLGGIAEGEQGGSQELTLTPAQLPPHPHEATALIAAAENVGKDENPENNVLAVVTLDDHVTQLPAYAPLSSANATLAPEAMSVTVQNTGDNQPVSLLNPYLGTKFLISPSGGTTGPEEFFRGEIRLSASHLLADLWVACEGQLMPIAQNRELFGLLKTTFGGDGVTTFALPDYRGRVPVGMGTGPGLDGITQGQQGGLQELTLELGQMPGHTHGATALISVAGKPGTTESPANGIPAIAVGEDGSTRLSAYAPWSAANVPLAPKGTKVTVESAGDGQPVPLMNPFLGTKFVIALEGTYPSRT